MHYHLVGIGGISMSGLKELLEKTGHTVTGSDLKFGGHKAENITSDVDVVVRTSAVNPGSPGWVEVEAAEHQNIPVKKRSEVIGEITKDKKLITISGMHGKTTITSLVGLTLIEAGLDPTVLVGEKLKEFSGDVLRVGKSEYFVLEACEYDRSFLDFYPKIAIISNIDLEHLDTYPGGIEEIVEAFKQFAGNIKENGTLILYGKDENLKKVASSVRDDIMVIYYDEKEAADFEIKLPGTHNKANAAAVLALSRKLKIDDSAIRKVLREFSGAKRRMEYYGEVGESLVYDDYGHHPTEIKATISALREKHPGRRLAVVFWPHQYKRIKPLVNQFAEAFSEADKVIIKPIFFVPGRDEKLEVKSEDIRDQIDKSKVDVSVSGDDGLIASKLKSLSGKWTILTLGIPPVYKIAEILIED
jgi:UDP-N-acetylmuramate--alanine ligase